MSKTGELSKLFGIDRTTLNYYVRQGLIRPDKGENQYHSYSFADGMALAYIRYYRGLGFSSDEVKQLLNEEDPGARLACVSRKKEGIEKEILKLRFKQALLGKLQKTLTRIAGQRDVLVRFMQEPYYFIRKADMENDSVWMRLYREVPLVEFVPVFNAETGLVELPDFFQYSGLFMQEEWLKETFLAPPENSVYYSAREKYMILWNISSDHPERDLSEKVKALFRDPPGNGKFHEKFVLYLIPSGYTKKNSSFDALCFFEIES